MPAFSTPAILLRRRDYGDYDLIITFFTLRQGKTTMIAKAAKKSSKRFAGVLELFALMDIVGTVSRGRGMPVLQEASLKQPFSTIRTDIKKTAFASYWAELADVWLEEYQQQAPLFFLLQQVLQDLDRNALPVELISIIFQVKFLQLCGYGPNLGQCRNCRRELEHIEQAKIYVDIAQGGILCDRCGGRQAGRIGLSKGTLKQILWIERGNLAKASRIRFTSQGLAEGLEFLEVFVPFHIGKQPRSLNFLKQLRKRPEKR